MKGILFKPWKIKAIAEDDREWMTRRLGGLKEINKTPDKWIWNQWQESQAWCSRFDTFWFDDSKGRIDAPRIGVKPRYQVGEVVYIKEAYGDLGWFDKGIITHKLTDKKGIEHDIIYPSDNPDFEWRGDSGGVEYRKDGSERSYWKSPMMMPEWAARYFIKITDIRAERLQEITEEDARAEGVKLLGYTTQFGRLLGKNTYRWSFEQLWDSINPKYPWESNPWVFVYSFKKAEK